MLSCVLFCQSGLEVKRFLSQSGVCSAFLYVRRQSEGRPDAPPFFERDDKRKLIMTNNKAEKQTMTGRFGLPKVFGRRIAIALGLLTMLGSQHRVFGQSPAHWSSGAYSNTSPTRTASNPHVQQGVPAPQTTTLRYTNPYDTGQSAVHVREYVRQDNTYVAPHYRSAPDGNTSNNWSTQGNVNPYTGKVGTRRR